ncbi:MAG: arylsulfatase [Flavobacteriaceae bacterium]
MKFQFLIILATLLIFNSCKKKTVAVPARGTSQPNVILILADDQGWGDLSFNGNTNLNTPHIDAIARNGVSFENFYVQPVCSPTRAELLTGRHFARMGVYATSAGGERFNLGETTIAELFKNAGYQTAAYGKWHNGMQPPYHPNARGFDDFYGFASGHWGNYFDPMLERNGAMVRGSGFLVDDLTNKGLEFISKNKDNPFFLYLPFNTPHSPMQVPGKFWNSFSNKALSMKYKDSLEENANFTRAALAMVENIDHNVGRISAELEALGLMQNTIIVYLSDNGPNGWRWNGGMRGRKGSTDEGGVRSPFFIACRDALPAGKKVSKIAGTTDILPTLAALANLPLETANPVDGKDLSPLLFDENPNWTDRVIYNHWGGRTSVRSQTHRLDHENKLYDISQDRGQEEDVSATEPELLDSLIAIKTSWLSEVNIKEVNKASRPFPLGHPDYIFTQLPARDGIAHGNIKRSNKYPNDSFFTDWTSVNDSISWNVDVLETGEFEVQLYYTCAPSSVGTTLQLTFLENTITKQVLEAHDPPLTGMENDRHPRIESYVKDFKPINLGTMKLRKGQGFMTLKAENIKNGKGIEVRLLLFSRKR